MTFFVLVFFNFFSPILYFSKLLQQLDKATEEDPVGIEEAVLDKGLNYQLSIFMLIFPTLCMSNECRLRSQYLCFKAMCRI